MTRRIAFLALLAAFLALPVMAADHGAAYYKRTGTKPPVKLAFFMGPKVHYGDQFGLGVQGALLDKTHGIAYTLSLDAVRIDPIHGTVPFGCYQVPVDIDSRTRGVVSFGMLFEVKKPK